MVAGDSGGGQGQTDSFGSKSDNSGQWWGQGQTDSFGSKSDNSGQWSGGGQGQTLATSQTVQVSRGARVKQKASSLSQTIGGG